MPRPYPEVEPGPSPLKTRGASITNPKVFTRENPLARHLWHWDSDLKFIYPVSRILSGKVPSSRGAQRHGAALVCSLSQTVCFLLI